MCFLCVRRFFLLKRAIRAIRRLKELRAAALKRSNELRGMLLEEYKVKAFQSVSLRLFDLPHQPRRMRQAMRIWRTWREQTKLKAKLKDIRGDGLSALHQADEEWLDAMSGLSGAKANESDTNVDYAMEALKAASVCRGMSQTQLRALRAKTRTTSVRARERVGATVTRDELTILVEGDIELRGSVELDVSERGGGEARAMSTTCSRPGMILNSLMDILEHIPERVDGARADENAKPESVAGAIEATVVSNGATDAKVSTSPRSSSAERVRVSLTVGDNRTKTREPSRVSARAGDRGCVLAVVSMADYHECAGYIIGTQGVALKLASGFTTICKYLCMVGDIKALWVNPQFEDADAKTDALPTNSMDENAPLACNSSLVRFLGEDTAQMIDTSKVQEALERGGYRRRSKPTKTSGGGFFSSRKSNANVTATCLPDSSIVLEAKVYPPGATVLEQGASAAALIIEHGSVEAFLGAVPHGVEKPPRPTAPVSPTALAQRKTMTIDAPIFTATTGDIVGGHLMLTGQRSGLTIRAGRNGAVVVALPLSAYARLARALPGIHRTSAADLARRVRRAPSSLVWDRCGAEMDMLQAGESLRQLNGGVHIVVTGCLREQLEESIALARAGSSGNLLKRRTSSGDVKISAANPLMAAGYIVGPGEATGEDSVLTESSAIDFTSPKLRRASSGTPSRIVARAVRDSQVLWISSAGLDTLALAAPAAFVRLARGLGLREANRSAALSSTNAQASHNIPGISQPQTTSTRSTAPKTVSIIPVTEGAALNLDEFCHSLTYALRKICRVRAVDSASRLTELGQAAIGPLAEEAAANWLSQLESAYDVVVLKGDPFPSPWCTQCARHSDLVLLVASAEDFAPLPSEGRALQERLLHGQGATKLQRTLLAQRELVILHQDAEHTPTNTKLWLEAFSVRRHHHVAMRAPSGLAPAHAARLARSLRQISVGVVLGGGGARGLAHVGVLAALEEEGVPIDAIGGTSIGAMVGGAYARDPSALLVRATTGRFAKEMSSLWRRLMDITIPIVSYFTGTAMNIGLRSTFGATKIEDCWLPFFCCTMDLISCVPMVHRNGTLWRYVRASMALVGFLPPVCDTEPGDDSKLHVLVDGGYVNNLPTDVMRALGARYVIAVDVAGEGLPGRAFKPWGDGISGTMLLLRSLLPRWLGGGHSIPTMADMQGQLPFVTDTVKSQTRLRDVDVYVRPDVATYGILEFNKYSHIVAAGYTAGIKLAREWKSQNPDVALLLEQGSQIRKGLLGASAHRARKANIPSATHSRESDLDDLANVVDDDDDHTVGIGRGDPLMALTENALLSDFEDDEAVRPKRVGGFALHRTHSDCANGAATSMWGTPEPATRRRSRTMHASDED